MMKLSPVEHAWLPDPPKSWRIVPAWSLFTEGTEGFNSDDPHLIPSRLHGVVTQDQYTELTGLRTMSNDVAALVMKHVDPDDFVISMGSHETGIEHSPIAGKVSNDYRVLKPTSAVVPAYFRWFFKSRPLIEGLSGLTNEIRVGQRIHYSKFATLWLPLPSSEVQQRIADYLDRETGEIDAMIAKMDELAGQLEARRDVVIEQTISKHFDGPSVPLAFASSPENFFDGDWVESKDQDPNGDIRLLQLADVGVGAFLDKSSRFINDEAFVRLGCRELFAGDVLIARMPDPIGRACVLPDGLGRTITVVDVAVVRVDQAKILPQYLAYVLNSPPFRELLESLQSGSTRQRISRSRLGQQRVPAARIIDQRIAVAHLDEVTGKIDAMLAKVAELKSLLTERRAALITDVVTGRKDVA